MVLHSVNETVLDGLNKPTRTYFKLDFGHGKTLEVSDRFLHFSNANNFRDLGGYRTSDGHHTKWGLLFRSNSLHDLLGEEKDILTNQLKLKEIFDLRGDSEVKVAPDEVPNLTYTRLPIASESMTAVSVKPKEGQAFGEALLQAGYLKIIDAKGKEVFGPWLKSLAEKSSETLPSVLHCTAGKDRTGVAYAILLSLLGVPKDTIIADYSLTNLTYDSLAKSFEKSGYPANYKSMLLAYPNAISATLEYIDTKYGSVEKYANEIGVSTDDIVQLRRHLLE